MKHYHTIASDIGQVLVRFEMDVVLRALACRLGIDSDVVRSLLGSDIQHDFEQGLLTTSEFCRLISARLLSRLSPDEVTDFWCQGFCPPALPSLALLQKLRSRFFLIAASNTNAIHYTFLEEHFKVATFFDDVVLSHRVHACKPDRAFFEHLITRIKCPPDACIFIDDSAVNIVAARSVGLESIHFTTPVNLLASLDQLGIPVTLASDDIVLTDR